VLDAFETIGVCVQYRIGRRLYAQPPAALKAWSMVEPVYERFPGWRTSTKGITRYEDLPENARKYLEKLEEMVGVPFDIISTGPERSSTIVRKNPFLTRG
jgi:adenylosuccinate synthase